MPAVGASALTRTLFFAPSRCSVLASPTIELGRAVIRLAEIAAQPRGGGGHQDAAIILFAHRVPHRLGGEGRAEQMDAHDRFEIRRGHLGKALVTQDTGVVDQDMDAAPGFLCPRGGFGHLRKVRDIAAIGDRGPAGCADFLDHGQRRISRTSAGNPGAVARAAQVVDHHARASPSQFQRISPAQPAARAGDDGDLVMKGNAHCRLLSV